MVRDAFHRQRLKASSTQELAVSYSSRSLPGPSSPRRTQYPTSQIPSRVENDSNHFFDRVKRALDNRETYNEFLKLVNLFTQGFIDMARLVKESRNYLGETELLRKFQEILGWDDRKEREHYLSTLETGWIQPTITCARDRPGRINMNAQYGSYRRLPSSVRCLVFGLRNNVEFLIRKRMSLALGATICVALY